MNLFEALLCGNATSDKVAVNDGRTSLTGTQLALSSLAFSRFLDASLPPDTRHVGMLLPNCTGFVTSFFGILASRRVALPFNPLLEPPELSAILGLSDTTHIVTVSPLKEKAEKILAGSGEKAEILYLDTDFARFVQAGEGLLDEQSIRSVLSELCAVPDSETACILCTSGTLGKTKGVMLSHRNLIKNLESMGERLHVVPDDVFIGLLPMFHSFGLTVNMLLPLQKQATTIPANTLNPAEIAKIIHGGRVSILVAVPTLLGLLLKYAQNDASFLSSVRVAVSGGEHLPANLEAGLRALFGSRLLVGYGLTEASPVVSVNHLEGARQKAGSVGQPLSGVEVQILDDAGNPLPAGTPGKLMVRGGNVMTGYYRDPDATKEALLPDGWLKTGDFGMLDEDGYLYITGREKDIIICAGKNIYPREIEEVLLEHPHVAEAVVVGIEVADRGEVPKAFIRCRDNAIIEEKTFRQMLKGRLAHYKWPREFEIVEDFPRNSLGKILRQRLRV